MPSPSYTQAWNTHVHVFDHERHPFKATRLYTPHPSSIQDLINSSDCENHLLVEASFENGMDGVLQALESARKTFPDRKFRAEVFWDTKKDQSRDTEELHRLGVRCLRLHAEFGNGGHATDDNVVESLLHLQGIASRHDWAVAAQLPMSTWINIIPRLGLLDINNSDDSVDDSSTNSKPIIIAEHFGSPALPPHTVDQAAEFDTFTDYLSRSSGFYVKLSALHRRVSAAAPEEDMMPLITKLAEKAPDKLLYGSDFPHVDVETRSMELTPHLKVDGRKEYSIVERALSPVALRQMLVDNPRRIFS